MKQVYKAPAPVKPVVKAPSAAKPQRSSQPRSRVRAAGRPKATRRSGVRSVASSLPAPKPTLSRHISSIAETSPYWETLCEPESVHGARIPDVSFQESGTMTTEFRYSFTVGTPTSGTTATGFYLGGASSTRHTTLIPKNEAWGGANDSSTPGVMGCIVGSASNAADPFNDTLSGVSSVTPIQFPAYTAMRGITDQCRLVSMSVDVQCGAAPLNQSGFYIAGVLPSCYHNDDLTWNNESSDSLKTKYQSLVVPVADGGVRLRYQPTDLAAFDYTRLDLTHNDVDYAPESRDVAEFFVVVEGAAVGATFIATVVMNWEYLPLDNTLMVGIEPSTVDYATLEYALNSLAKIETASASSGHDAHEALASSSASSSSVLSVGASRSSPSGGVLVLHSKPVSRLVGRASAKGRRKRPQKPAYSVKSDSSSASTLDKMGSMLISLAEKVAPAILAAIL